jgi:hypothetical protein
VTELVQGYVYRGQGTRKRINSKTRKNYLRKKSVELTEEKTGGVTIKYVQIILAKYGERFSGLGVKVQDIDNPNLMLKKFRTSITRVQKIGQKPLYYFWHNMSRKSSCARMGPSKSSSEHMMIFLRLTGSLLIV